MTRTLREIIAATVSDPGLQIALEQALMVEGYSLEPPTFDGAQYRLRGTATLSLESLPGVDGSTGVTELKADMNVWLDGVFHEGTPWPAAGYGFSDPDTFVRYNIRAEGFTVPMEDGETHLKMWLRDPDA